MLVDSSADCNAVAYTPWHEGKPMLIKNKVYSVETMLGPEFAAKESEGTGEGTLILCRLGPHHLHRAYAPCDATFDAVWEGGLALHTVKPQVIGHESADVLGMNQRKVLSRLVVVAQWAKFFARAVTSNTQLHFLPRTSTSSH